MTSQINVPPPKRTIAECHAILTGMKGGLHETEYRLIDGRVQKVYKNIWPSLREFWLAAVQNFGSREYVVYENDRLTYGEVHAQAVATAHWLREVYGCREGDRVAVVTRNYPEWIIAFWATHLLGCVLTAVNSWLPPDALAYCLRDSGARVAIVDDERRAMLTPHLLSLQDSSGDLRGLVVVRGETGGLPGVRLWKDLQGEFRGRTDLPKVEVGPDDNASIFFTSGTTGLPKGVLSSQRQFLTNVPNAVLPPLRRALRKGENIPTPDPNAPQKASLVSVPLFHVTGCQSLLGVATFTGGKVVLMYKWNAEKAVDLIIKERCTTAGGVPLMARELINSRLSKSDVALESLFFGGAPAAVAMAKESAKNLPNIMLSQGYGMTETNSVAVSMAGEDYMRKPDSVGVCTPVNEILVVDPDTGVERPVGQLGEIWLKGPNVCKGYWNKPEENDKAFTKDGWYRSGDLGFVDEEGFIYVRDRVKDIIIRGGENISSVVVENAVYSDSRVADCAAVPLPHPTLGEVVSCVVVTREGFHGKLTQEHVQSYTAKLLPRGAVPEFVVFREKPIDRNAAGKVVKKDLKNEVLGEWKKRGAGVAKATAKL